MEIAEFQEYFKGKDMIIADGNMTNYDHFISDDLETELKENPCKIADYAAWEFHGNVFYKDGQFHCYVMRYQIPQGIYSADTLEKLMELCCNEFGEG